MTTNQWIHGFLATAVGLGVCTSSIALAQTIAVSAGYAEQTNVFEFAAVWDRSSALIERLAWRVTGHVELDVMDLQGRRSNVGGYQSIGAVGMTPFGRFEWPSEEYSPFVDVGIGINFLSHTSLQEVQQFGIALQFGEFVGTGLRFGQNGAYEIGVRLQHMSNANIKFPNDGITFGAVRIAYHF